MEKRDSDEEDQRHGGDRRKNAPSEDWAVYHPEEIPTKGIKLPSIFYETLDTLVSHQKEERCSLQILELGCGCGALSVCLATEKGHVVTGVDVNEGAIARAKESYAGRSTSDVGEARFFVANVVVPLPPQASPWKERDFDFCILQLLLSIVGRHAERRQSLQTAFDALRSKGKLYVSASGVSGDINHKYQSLYERDAPVIGEAYSYYSRDGHGDILYTTHHFSTQELTDLLADVGFVDICIQQHREASSRRPSEAAYFLYAVATRP